MSYKFNPFTSKLDLVNQAGGVTSVSNSDGSLTISPTTGIVIASLNLGNGNNWTAPQTFTGVPSILIGSSGSYITPGTQAGYSDNIFNFSFGTPTSDSGGIGTYDAGFVFDTDNDYGSVSNAVLFDVRNQGVSWLKLTTFGSFGHVLEILADSSLGTEPILTLTDTDTGGAVNMTYDIGTSRGTLTTDNNVHAFEFQGSDNYFNPQDGASHFQVSGTEFALVDSSGFAVIDTGSSNNIHLIAPTLAASWTLTLPTTSGSKNQFLQDTGSGVATWSYIPAVFNRLTAKTSAQASVATYTPTADGSFLISANVLVTAATTASFTTTCTYTDEGNTSRTVTLNFSNLTGTFLTTITNVTGTGPYEGVPLHIRVKASTAITIATVGTFTSVTYNVEGSITQLN